MSDYTDMTSAFFYKKLLTWQDMDRMAENDAYLLGNHIAPGAVVEWWTNSAPTSYVFAEGQAISRTGDGAALFALWGTKYGIGDGSSTFNVLDKRGRGSIGAGTGSGLTARTLDDNLGAETHKHATAIWRRSSDGSLIVPPASPYGTNGATGDATGGGGFTAGAAADPNEAYLTDSGDSLHPVKVCRFIIKL